VVVFEEGGSVQRYAGGFSDWQKRGRALTEKENPGLAGARETATKEKPRAAPAKLSYKLKLELEQLPARIETLEKAVAALQAQANDPDFYAQPFEQVQPVLDELAARQKELDEAIARWA